MSVLIWSSWHICFAALCAALLRCCNLWHVDLISGLAYTRITIDNRLIVKLFSHFNTYVWWRLVFGLTLDHTNMWPLTVFCCAIVILAKHLTLVIQCGSCLWMSVHEDTGHCILKQNCYRHCLWRCCSYNSKLIIKPDDKPGFCCSLIPNCQWQYSTVYTTRVSTKTIPSRVVKCCTVLFPTSLGDLIFRGRFLSGKAIIFEIW